MCELHFYKCACGARWTEAKRLSSCDDPATGGGDGSDTAPTTLTITTTTTRCPDSLCMHVGNPRRPQKKECDSCRQVREMLETMEDEEQDGSGAGMFDLGRAAVGG